MALSSQLWKLDTCGCVIEEFFDKDLPPDQHDSTRQIKTFWVKCPRHNQLSDRDAYIQALAEMRTINLGGTVQGHKNHIENNFTSL
jgi:hypothetical protein